MGAAIFESIGLNYCRCFHGTVRNKYNMNMKMPVAEDQMKHSLHLSSYLIDTIHALDTDNSSSFDKCAKKPATPLSPCIQIVLIQYRIHLS